MVFDGVEAGRQIQVRQAAAIKCVVRNLADRHRNIHARQIPTSTERRRTNGVHACRDVVVSTLLVRVGHQRIHGFVKDDTVKRAVIGVAGRNLQPIHVPGPIKSWLSNGGDRAWNGYPSDEITSLERIFLDGLRSLGNLRSIGFRVRIINQRLTRLVVQRPVNGLEIRIARCNRKRRQRMVGAEGTIPHFRQCSRNSDGIQLAIVERPIFHPGDAFVQGQRFQPRIGKGIVADAGDGGRKRNLGEPLFRLRVVDKGKCIGRNGVGRILIIARLRAIRSVVGYNRDTAEVHFSQHGHEFAHGLEISGIHGTGNLQFRHQTEFIRGHGIKEAPG